MQYQEPPQPVSFRTYCVLVSVLYVAAAALFWVKYGHILVIES